MLAAGDEMGRTQNGNNNAYCQDNEISWLNWELDSHDREFMQLRAVSLIKLRKEHPVFHRRRFFQGRRIKGANVKDICWLRPDGEEMTRQGMATFYFARCLGLLLHGDAIEEQDERGRKIHDDTFLLLLNAHHQPFRFACRNSWASPAGGSTSIPAMRTANAPTVATFTPVKSYPLQATLNGTALPDEESALKTLLPVKLLIYLLLCLGPVMQLVTR